MIAKLLPPKLMPTLIVLAPTHAVVTTLAVHGHATAWSLRSVVQTTVATHRFFIAQYFWAVAISAIAILAVVTDANVPL